MCQEIVSKYAPSKYAPCKEVNHFVHVNWVGCDTWKANKHLPKPCNNPSAMTAKRIKKLDLSSCPQCDQASAAEKQRKIDQERERERKRKEKAELEQDEIEERIIAEGGEILR
jgi:hypothetical protein